MRPEMEPIGSAGVEFPAPTAVVKIRTKIKEFSQEKARLDLSDRIADLEVPWLVLLRPLIKVSRCLSSFQPYYEIENQFQ
jgi:hypothetical protein